MKDPKDFDNWYKTKITENDQDPPEDAWQNISDELDTNDVWDRIAVELDSPRGWSAAKAIYYSLPVLLLFLLGGGAYYYFNTSTDVTPVSTLITTAEDSNNLTHATEPLPEVEEVGKDEKVGEVGKDEEDEEVEMEEEVGEVVKRADVKEAENVGKVRGGGELAKRIEAKKAEEARQVREANVTGESSEGVKREALVVAFGHDRTAHLEELTTGSEGTSRWQQRLTSATEKHAGIPPVMMPDSMLNIYPVTVSLHPDSLEQIAVAEGPQKIAYSKRFEFGLTASAKNTWLLNRRTLAGLEKHTLNTTLPDFGKDIGLMFAWNFSPALSAQAEGMFLSEAGQRYKEYRNGKYVDREVDLRYYSLNVLLKYRLNKARTGHPVNGSALIAGFYGSTLNKATELINGEVSDSRPAYHDHNYGVIFGYEYNRYVLPKVILSSGLRMNYGFPNIDTSVFTRTFTGSVDLNIAIKYRLGGK